MSIQELIKDQVKCGNLIYYKPTLAIDPIWRHLFVSAVIYEAITLPATANEADDVNDLDARLIQMRADFDRYVKGEVITVAHDPYKKSKKAYLARIDPIEKEIWDIRSIDPKPAVRVLGAFSEKDTFIALEYEFRNNLKGPKSREWRDFILRSDTHWKKLFFGLLPHGGKSTNDYISENTFDV